MHALSISAYVLGLVTGSVTSCDKAGKIKVCAIRNSILNSNPTSTTAPPAFSSYLIQYLTEVYISCAQFISTLHSLNMNINCVFLYEQHNSTKVSTSIYTIDAEVVSVITAP
jgi:hypothetical protein